MKRCWNGSLAVATGLLIRRASAAGSLRGQPCLPRPWLRKACSPWRAPWLRIGGHHASKGLGGPLLAWLAAAAESVVLMLLVCDRAHARSHLRSRALSSNHTSSWCARTRCYGLKAMARLLQIDASNTQMNLEHLTWMANADELNWIWYEDAANELAAYIRACAPQPIDYISKTAWDVPIAQILGMCLCCCDIRSLRLANHAIAQHLPGFLLVPYHEKTMPWPICSNCYHHIPGDPGTNVCANEDCIQDICPICSDHTLCWCCAHYEDNINPVVSARLSADFHTTGCISWWIDCKDSIDAACRLSECQACAKRTRQFGAMQALTEARNGAWCYTIRNASVQAALTNKQMPLVLQMDSSRRAHDRMMAKVVALKWQSAGTKRILGGEVLKIVTQYLGYDMDAAWPSRP